MCFMMAEKAAEKKAPAKKTAEKKETAVKKPAEKKAPAKTAAKKAPAAKKAAEKPAAEPVKAAEQAAPEKKAPAKKTAAAKKTAEKKAPAAKKSAEKKAVAAKKPAKKIAPVVRTILQVNGKDYDISGMAEKALKSYKSVHKRKVVTDFALYVKPEENAAYFTINGEGGDDYKLPLDEIKESDMRTSLRLLRRDVFVCRHRKVCICG